MKDIAEVPQPMRPVAEFIAAAFGLEVFEGRAKCSLAPVIQTLFAVKMVDVVREAGLYSDEAIPLVAEAVRILWGQYFDRSLKVDADPHAEADGFGRALAAMLEICRSNGHRFRMEANRIAAVRGR